MSSAAGYASVIYDSIEAVPPADWAAVTAGAGLAADPRLLSILARTLADQCRCWTLLVRDPSGRPVAAACLCQFAVDALDSTSPKARAIAAGVRKIWRNFAKFPVMFCGLPVPAGATHLWFAPGVEVAALLPVVHDAICAHARTNRAKLVVIKELSDGEKTAWSALGGLGYLTGGIPALHCLSRPFKDFDDYAGSLKARYRSQINRSRKKLVQGGFGVEYARGTDAVLARYTDDVHALYEAVWSRSQYRLEILPAEFVRDLAKQFDQDVALTLICRDGKVAAFTLSLAAGDLYYNMYSGLDYALNNDGDLYFNLFYADLDAAWKRGFSDVHLGQTSDDFKSRLGTTAEPRYFLVRAMNPVIRFGMRRFAKLAFPPVTTPEPHDVFSTPPVAKKTGRRPQMNTDERG